jgi:MFS family permease
VTPRMGCMGDADPSWLSGRAPSIGAVFCDAVPEPPDHRASYRALLDVPSLGRVLAGMQLGRIAAQMAQVAIVLFTLLVYRSPALAGLVTFAALVPGIVTSPIAGALLDRRGRSRLIVLDYLVAAATMALIAGLAAARHLPAWLLVLIAAASSLTQPLSATGLKSLLPLLVPRRLWERVNALDSNGYVLATMVGPPAAGLTVQLAGATLAIALVGAVFGAAALVMAGCPDPRPAAASGGRLASDAWQGVVYVWRNRTLRALAFSIGGYNVGVGILTIALPVLVLQRLHLGAAAVGGLFAVMGGFGMLSALLVGRAGTEGRERRLLGLPMLGTAGAFAVLAVAHHLVWVALALALAGLLTGPVDVALFTVRQRRTHPAWMGRAFAVSASLNFLGVPVGSGLAGTSVALSLSGTLLIASACALAAALVAWRALPSRGGPVA